RGEADGVAEVRQRLRPFTPGGPGQAEPEAVRRLGRLQQGEAVGGGGGGGPTTALLRLPGPPPVPGPPRTPLAPDPPPPHTHAPPLFSNWTGSPPPPTRRLPSGLKERPQRAAAGPCKAKTCCPVRVSQSLISHRSGLDGSWLAAARRRPSGLKQTLQGSRK